MEQLRESEAAGASVELLFEEFFRSEYLNIARDAYFIVRDRELAKDVAQEAFARASVRWHRLSRYDKPGAWVRRIAIRIAVKQSKRKSREVAPTESGPTTSVDTKLAVRAAIDSLPGQQRAAIVLHYFHDLDIPEVAAALGCRRSTADVHLHRARQKLAQLLSDGEE